MDWLKQLKANSVKKSIPGLILFVGIAVAVVLITRVWHVFGILAPKTLDELTPETLDGAFVDDDIYYIYGSYLEIESYRDNRRIGTSGMQYLIDMDETYYMGLFVHAGKVDEAEQAEKDLDEFYETLYTMDSEPSQEFLDSIPVFHVRGMVRAMDDDDLGYYRDATADLDDASLFLPYYLEVDYVNGIPVWGCFALLAGVLFLLWLGVWPMVKALRGGFQKQVRAKLAEDGSPERAAEQAELFYNNTPEVCGVRMSSSYVFFQDGAESILLRPWDVAWAYQSTTQHRTNGIPSGKTYAAVLRTMDGKQYTLGMKEAQVKELLEAMSTALPGTVLGYDKQLEQTYKNNRDAFRQRWAEHMPQGTAH